jgi:hypothetical protein
MLESAVPLRTFPLSHTQAVNSFEPAADTLPMGHVLHVVWPLVKSLYVFTGHVDVLFKSTANSEPSHE